MKDNTKVRKIQENRKFKRKSNEYSKWKATLMY